MKKLVLQALIIFINYCSFAQTGIGTVSPQGSTVLELESDNKALLLSRVDNTAMVSNPENGMIIYDKASHCIKVYQNGYWSDCIFVPQGTIATMNCAGASHTGILKQGIPSKGVVSSIPYTAGNGAAHHGQSVASTGVTGLTATLGATAFANGNGTLVYYITGIPASAGIASFAVSIGGKTCILTRNVVAPAIPPNITLAREQSLIVSSIYDTDYLPYAAPMGDAFTTPLAADGTTDPAIDFQGTITTAGINVTIPVSATGAGTIAAYTSTAVSIPASLTQDGITRNIVLSWAAQTYTAATKSINATLKAIGGVLNIKKLDVNNGLGVDALGIMLGNLTYPYNTSEAITTLTLRAASGIPDKMYGIADNTGSTETHKFIYMPIVGEDGKVWLSNNLGANYANVNMTAIFNPNRQANTATDYQAYGSLSQWGRKPDGHELINRTGPSQGASSRANGTTAVLSDNPAHALFITANNYPYSWRVIDDTTLWANETSANNPCPKGFRVPAIDEFASYVAAAGLTNNDNGAASNLKLTSGGFNFFNDGTFQGIATNGFYYSSTNFESSTNAYYLELRNNQVLTTQKNSRGYGFSIRCIKN